MKRYVSLLTLSAITAAFLMLSAEKPYAPVPEWKPLKDGQKNLLFLRSTQVGDRSILIEVRNDYEKAAVATIEVETRWDWLSFDVGYAYEHVVIQPSDVMSQQIKGSRLVSAKVKNLRLVEPKPVAEKPAM